MRRIKRLTLFVGKSIAFALISGAIWSYIVILVVTNFEARRQPDVSTVSSSSRSAAQMDDYDRQMKAAKERSDRSEELQSRSAKLLDTQERLFSEQEKLQKRFSAILDKWERIPAR